MPPDLILPSELTICSVAGLRPQWQAWVDAARDEAGAAAAQPPPCRVDGAAVDDVDAAGVQLLLSLSQTLAQEHRTLHLVNASQRLSRACEALGVSAALAGTPPTGDMA